VALGALVHELQHVCQWEGLSDLSRRLIETFEELVDSKIAAPLLCRIPWR